MIVCVCVGRVIGEERCYLWREQQGHARMSWGLPCRESFFRLVSWWWPLWAPTGSTTWRKKKFFATRSILRGGSSWIWHHSYIDFNLVLLSDTKEVTDRAEIHQCCECLSSFTPSSPFLNFFPCYLSILLLVASVKCVCLRPLLPHLHLFSDILPNFVLKENDLALYLSCLKTLEFLYTAQFPNFPEDHWVSLWRLRRTDKWLCVCWVASVMSYMDCSPPGSSVHGILQAWTLERVAISFARGSSPPREPASFS